MDTERSIFGRSEKIAKINDRRIATIHDAWTENGCYCCSMEFIDGITYEKWLEKNLEINKRINMLLKIFDAIIFYQSQGIIHGDIHSKNIMIDRNESIHIIDFGTSSMSSYKEQSEHRENYLMYELVEKTMTNHFDDRVFWLKKYSIRGKIQNKEDVRNAIPVMFSKSVISYLNLYIMITNLNDIINQPQDIYEYCRNIAKGFYLNMDYFFSIVPGENQQRMNIFSNTMFESLEDEVYEDAQNNLDKADIVEFLSLYVYYEDVKNGLNAGTISDEIKKKYIEKIFVNEATLIIQGLDEAEDLFTFHEYLLKKLFKSEKIYEIESNLRGCLYAMIEDAYSGYLLHILRKQYLRMTQIKMNEELYTRTIRLSYIYCLNNGINT